jgi:two-component system, sensor histidine kinase and response regulator
MDAAIPAPLPAAAARRADILVVDDTPENLGVVSSVLKQAGHRVRAVTSGALALEAARAEAPDLVLLDINMPQMDGYEVCRRFKQDPALAGVPIIFLSALSETDDKVRAFEAGGVDYVQKPFRAPEITARVETHLALRRFQLELEERNRDLRHSYARLESLERARHGLVQMIVHDLKNPITTIQVCAEVARDDAAVQGDTRLALDDILGVTKVLTRMVLDVLDVASSENASLRPRLQAVNLGKLLGDATRDAEKRAQQSGKTLSLALDPALPAEVRADPNLLRRVVDNLLDNAFKYAPRETAIRLEGAAAGADFVVAVRDQGDGVPRADRERIFEAYSRLERDRDRAARVSRGLGLAFCRLAAEAHRGRIWVEDNAPRGSAFVLRLPRDPERGPAE